MQANDRFNNLRQLIATKPTHWKPSEGETLIGELIRWETFHNQFGEQYAAIIKSDADDYFSVALNEYLKKALKLAEAAIGDAIAIVYEGKGNSQFGTSYNKYQLIISKGA